MRSRMARTSVDRGHLPSSRRTCEIGDAGATAADASVCRAFHGSTLAGPIGPRYGSLSGQAPHPRAESSAAGSISSTSATGSIHLWASAA